MRPSWQLLFCQPLLCVENRAFDPFCDDFDTLQISFLSALNKDRAVSSVNLFLVKMNFYLYVLWCQNTVQF